jgi:hypothetical protein
MTATRGFVATDSACGVSFNVSLAEFCGFASGYHGLAALPKRETRRQTGSSHERRQRLREEICRLGRSLFERGLTPGSSGNISVRLDDGGWLVTPTNASLGSLDPARLSRLDPTAGSSPAMRRPRKCRCTPRCTRRAAARARRASAFDPFGGAVDAAGDRPARALPPMTAYYLMKCGADRAGALLSARRSRGGRRDQGPGREIFIRAARQSRPGGVGRHAGSRGVRDRGTGRDRKLYLLLRGLNPRYLTPAQVADLVKTFGLTLPEHSSGVTS